MGLLFSSSDWLNEQETTALDYLPSLRTSNRTEDLLPSLLVGGRGDQSCDRPPQQNLPADTAQNRKNQSAGGGGMKVTIWAQGSAP